MEWASFFKQSESLGDQNNRWLGRCIQAFNSEDLPSNGDVMICSFAEASFEEVRKELYQLAPIRLPTAARIFDLGHLNQGASEVDSLFVLTDLAEFALENDVLLIALSNLDITNYALYKGLEKFRKKACISMVSAKSGLSEKGWVNKVIEHKPNYLFSFNFLAVQQYLEHPDTSATADDLGFDFLRLGALRKDIKESEPLFRQSDLCHFDMMAIRASDYLTSINPNPNGLFGEEMCNLGRYAGFADTSRLFSFGPYWDAEDHNGNSAKLFAQLLWYVLEGWSVRSKDHPDLHPDFTTYKCELTEEKSSIHFFKSLRSERWWMAIPSKRDRDFVIPCTYADYQKAARGEMPERFFKALRKSFDL